MRPGVSAAAIRRARIGRKWGPRLLVLNLLGYPLVALFATAMNWDSTVASIPFRALVLGISVFLIVKLGPRSPWWRHARWPLLFATVYLARLLWDSLVVGMTGALEATAFFVGTVLVPSLAQGLASYHPASQRRTAWLLALTGAAICAGAMMLQLFAGSARMLNPMNTGGRLAFEALNAISLGHVAATTLVAAMSIILFRTSPPTRALLGIIAMVASLCLLAAGSRGPIVALGFAAIAYAIITHRWRWIFAIGLVIGITLLRTETSVVDRFASGGEDESSLARLVLQGNAILQFFGSPIFGSAYAELESFEYPHNLFIETAMALGVVGLLLLTTMLFSTFFAMRREWRGYEILVPMLFVQYFFGVQLSGSLWGSIGFWSLAFILSRSVKRSAERRRAPIPPAPPALAGHESGT